MRHSSHVSLSSSSIQDLVVSLESLFATSMRLAPRQFLTELGDTYDFA